MSSSGIIENVEKIRLLQLCCVECGQRNNLEVHHRIFRSEYSAEFILNFLQERILIYTNTYKKPFPFTINSYGLHNIPNLVILCNKCHNAIHSGNSILRNKYKESYTDPSTGFNIFYQKPTISLY